MLSPDEFYPALDESQTPLGPALLLLHEAERQLADGVEEAKNGDVMAADDAALRFLALLPELFCCRSLGDGFATLVSALFHGFRNRGSALNTAQMAAAHQSIRQLRRSPFVSYDEALVMVADLESVGMNVDPPALTIVGETLLG